MTAMLDRPSSSFMAGRTARNAILGITVAMAAVLLAPPPADAGGSHHRHHSSAVKWERRITDYYLGDSTNPLLGAGCGKAFHGVFMLIASLAPGDVRSCTVPAGMPLLAVPGGVLQWRSTKADTRATLRAAVRAGLATVTDPQASLDGKGVRTKLVRGYIHWLHLEPGNLIQAVDPQVTAHSTLVDTAAHIAWIHPLDAGSHVVYLSDKVDGSLVDITFNITAS